MEGIMTDLVARSQAIKTEALRLGFVACGISEATELVSESLPLLHWLQAGYHADMHYMERNNEKRTDPRKLVDHARSVVVLLHNYFPDKSLVFQSRYKIARYAYGQDYHVVLKDKMYQLMQFINQEIAPAQGRCFTDSAPVMERSWAVRSGLGWIGKNGNLLTRDFGSYVFISELILDLELAYDVPNPHNYCGSCNLCIENCPTQAIVHPGVIDSNKCISYLTIENKSDIPDCFAGKTENRIFGCDICQEVCPWNKKAKTHTESRFLPSSTLLNMNDQDWEFLKEEDFQLIFKKSPISRAGWTGLKRNITMAGKGKSSTKN